jgi:hypothetical protein
MRAARRSSMTSSGRFARSALGRLNDLAMELLAAVDHRELGGDLRTTLDELLQLVKCARRHGRGMIGT